MRMVAARILLGAFGFVLATPAWAGAHDFWIEPDAYQVSVGDRVGITLRVGEPLAGKSYRRNPQHLKSFVCVDENGAREVAGRPGDDPAGSLEIRTKGTMIVGYASNETVITLSAAKFESYLEEEGLDIVSGIRRERGESANAVTESFSRCAKAILETGGANSTIHDRVLGFTLELVPQQNPYALDPDSTLPILLLYNGNPVAGVRLTATNRNSQQPPVSSVTGDDGVAALRLNSPGIWLVTGIHITPGERDDAWISVWASLTFGIPESVHPGSGTR